MKHSTKPGALDGVPMWSRGCTEELSVAMDVSYD